MIIGIFLALAVGELFLRFVYAPESVKTRIYMNRLAASPDNFQTSFDPKNLRFLPNSSGEMVYPEYHVHVLHDVFGFRNPCLPSEPGMPRVLLVGDSFVYGVGVDDENTFSCQLNH